ncbi:SLIT-ROBO Rho GTPase-activating protein 1-like isoform X2 [Contarinia nasturtii]|uniref:SLIT-ROBO Rho GTPase-activating protein 1-like isoform X2 n=1 Tax=Contarinia nasturtii TaxID=265458 RepID=UPI0012D49B9F|nr:SLIT-ROBO Rho GTPase-activating protein 1-like isoform X2 [Contarinia nasturtii]XP_031636982.1 SLIT-ROBO Rho GTPase-activating protein 1-like isoform X2 [Contarinia nasturtii]
MFQCIIQQRNGWIHAPNPETRDVFPDIRLQLNEQLRCLDVRMESQVSLIQELQDFFRRRGEVELDYSRSLDKLAKGIQLRHKEQKQKREQWPMFSTYSCWQLLVNQTKALSKDHATLSEIYTTHLVARLQTVIEDVQRIYKKCREIGYETHEEILRVLQELHTTMKTYHSYQTECKAAEAKLRTAETQRMKLQQTIPKEKLDRSKKYRLIEKEMLKRKVKYTDARLKALKAKNEYQLCLEASNTTIHKYFVEDLSDLIDCMDLGFHSMMQRALLVHVTGDQGRGRAIMHNADQMSHTIHAMDSRADKQKFLEQYHSAFMIPKRLEFQGQLSEELAVEPELQKALHSEMEQRLQHLGQRVGNLRMESEEIWKTLETAEINLLEILNTKDYDSSSHFGDSTTQAAKPDNLTQKLKSDKQEIEEFYITKIREYILGTSRIARLDAKAELLRTELAKDSSLNSNATLLVKSQVPKRKRIGRMNMTGQPKLFGGSLEEYLEATGEEIPLIMRSCIRVINLYGLHHQGIFRVSGSQVEISNFREGFERGEDPLADTTDASDINSVAGVLKLYLRELREPLFPIIYFDHFVTLAQLESKHELVMGIRKFLQSLPRSVVIVMRYLFAFLNHLSEYSDENMMDAYNLAICFGPTLMPAPEEKDQVQCQNQVNDLIKNMIVFHEDLFPKDLGGTIYEKYISQEPFDCDVGDSPTEQVTEDPDSEVYPSEDESDTMEATAQFDFIARSDRELSLRKGDLVTLRKQVSNDWWQGTVRGKDGLIPDKYISLKIKDEDRDKSCDHLKSSSSEESVRKRRPSGNISINSQLSIFSQTTMSTELDTQHPSSQQGQPQQPPPLASQQSQSTGSHHSTHHSHPTTPHAQSKPIKISGNESTKSSSSSTSAESSADSTERLILTKQNTIVKASGSGSDENGDDFHYEAIVDPNVTKPKYAYHDEPHSFENSMEFLEDYKNFQYEKKRPSEPVYAEPIKPSAVNFKATPAARGSGGSTDASQSDEPDAVQLRHGPKTNENDTMAETEQVTYENTSILNTEKSGKARHSDSNLMNEYSNSNRDSETVALVQRSVNNAQRKYHSKSFSLSENRVAANLNLFQQNRELWEKRTEMQSTHSLTAPRILTRNRIAPDLVMDLPISNKECAVNSSRESLNSSDDTGVIDGANASGSKTVGNDVVNSKSIEDMTSAERFATQSQCTLKKNERFSAGPAHNNECNESMPLQKETQIDVKAGSSTVLAARSGQHEKPKAEIKPQESTVLKEFQRTSDNGCSESSTPAKDQANIKTTKDLQHKSPIPSRNTQKFVNQFADLKLTGGCMSSGANTTAINTVSDSTNSQQQPTSLSSFKPQVKVKPQILRKPLVLPPTTPELVRRNQEP